MASRGEFGSLRHLAGRFFGALDPRGPVPADERWARSFLVAGEQPLWQRMSGPDRRHAVDVARRTVRLLEAQAGAEPAREVVAAALLHDVGKVEAHLGTFARVAVTATAMAAGRDRVLSWASPAARSGPTPWRERTRRYLVHDAIGADLLLAAAADPLTVTWAAEHHLPPARWTVEPAVAAALKEADGD